MAQNQFKPQLVMARANLHYLPELQLPEGYAVRCYREGDGAAWERVVAAAFEREVQTGEFEKSIQQREAFRPERVLFVVWGDVPVATASAWDSPGWGPQTGQLHMVGTKPEHRGKHLGYWVSVAALHQFRKEGRRDVMLSTDDFRLPAIKTYLQMGFEPVLVDENQRRRWRDVFAAIDQPGLSEKFAEILDGPVFKPIASG